MLLPISSFVHFGWLLTSLFFCPKLYCISRFAHWWPIRPRPLRLNRPVWPAFCDSHQELVFVCLRGFLSLGCKFEQDFIFEIFMCCDQALFLHSHRPCSSQESFPAKAFFQPACFSSSSAIQEIIFSVREGKPFWNGRAPGKGCFTATSLFQGGTFSSPVQFPASLRSPPLQQQQHFLNWIHSLELNLDRDSYCRDFLHHYECQFLAAVLFDCPKRCRSFHS